MQILFILLFFAWAFILVEFIGEIVYRKNILPMGFMIFSEISVAITVIMFIIVNHSSDQDCCYNNPFISPEHSLTMYILIGLSLTGFILVKFSSPLIPPMLQVLGNVLVSLGILINIFVGIQLGWELALAGNLPITMVFIIALSKNHRAVKSNIDLEFSHTDTATVRLAKRILLSDSLSKSFIFGVAIFPLVFLSTIILLLFGQEVDSIIRAFTETYHHNLSNLDCTNVNCPDGHYLCTVAASGHNQLVKPFREGYRRGKTIKVNRQLLIANAFEELLEDHIPSIHRPIRKIYNVAGLKTKMALDCLENKWLADTMYILMKPLEYFFLLVLYTIDSKPENRIAVQYLKREDRRRIKIEMSEVF
ncbi:MAG: DUF6688 family protein [Bacteroidota bacterium]